MQWVNNPQIVRKCKANAISSYKVIYYTVTFKENIVKAIRHMFHVTFDFKLVDETEKDRII